MDNFIIDTDKQLITIPPDFTDAGVRSDHNALKIYFEIDKTYDGNDLSTHDIWVQYINANGEADAYKVTEIDLSTPDKIIFAWEISNQVTKYAGTVSFSIRFYTAVDKVYTYTYNTQPATFTILDGIVAFPRYSSLNGDLLASIPTKTSDLINDDGFISTETDPTVSAWAKEPTKPNYTAQEVGALPSTDVVNNQSTTVTGKALDATQANPSITGSLGYKIEQTNNELGDMKFYTTPEQLGLTEPSSISEVVNAMDDKSMLLFSVATPSYSAICLNKFGTLIIKKWNNYRVSLWFSLDVSNEEYVGIYHGTSGFTGWQQIVLSEKLNNNIISTSGLSCTWGTISDGGYAQVGKMIIVNIRITIDSALTSGTGYSITGLPVVKNNSSLNFVPVSINTPSKMTNGYITASGNLLYTPSTDINVGDVLMFSATYITV